MRTPPLALSALAALLLAACATPASETDASAGAGPDAPVTTPASPAPEAPATPGALAAPQPSHPPGSPGWNEVYRRMQQPRR